MCEICVGVMKDATQQLVQQFQPQAPRHSETVSKVQQSTSEQTET